MASRGRAIKQDSPQQLALRRPMITRDYLLTVDHEACCGCKLCEAICPQESISLSEAEVEDGRVISQARVDIDAQKCSFCGECVVVCPTRAIALSVNGTAEIPVQKYEAFPFLIRRVSVDQEAASASTDTDYIDDCPAGAISAAIERNNEGNVVAVRDVQIDRRICRNCTHCMEEGPEGAFQISKPYEGRIRLDISYCPEGCRACVDVCPTNALSYDGSEVVLDERFCLYCGACQNVCPAEHALDILRTGFVHTPIESGAWVKALEKLVSYQAVTHEYDIKRQRKRRAKVLAALLGIDQEGK